MISGWSIRRFLWIGALVWRILCAYLRVLSYEVIFPFFILGIEEMMTPDRRCDQMIPFGIMWSRKLLGENWVAILSILLGNDVGEINVVDKGNEDTWRLPFLVAEIAGVFFQGPEICWPVSLWHFPRC